MSAAGIAGIGWFALKLDEAGTADFGSEGDGPEHERDKEGFKSVSKFRHNNKERNDNDFNVSMKHEYPHTSGEKDLRDFAVASKPM